MNIFAIVRKLVNGNPDRPLNELIAEQCGMVGVKQVQRGVTSSAQTVTITAVNMSKAFVVSVSKGSSGSAGITGTLTIPAANSSSGSWDSNIGSWTSGNGINAGVLPDNKYISGSLSAKMPSSTYTVTAGQTNLTVGKYSAKLTGATKLNCDGACEWQVVEFY